MNEPVDPAASSIPLAASPMLQKALSRLRQIVNGNGLDPEAVMLTKSDEATYTINAEMRLTASWQLKPLTERAARGARIVPLRNSAELNALTTAGLPHMWLLEAQTDLQPLPGHGWGLDGKNIVLSQHTNVYGLEEACATCRGQGTVNCDFCHGRSQITCTLCHGAGHDPPRPVLSIQLFRNSGSGTGYRHRCRNR